MATKGRPTPSRKRAAPRRNVRLRSSRSRRAVTLVVIVTLFAAIAISVAVASVVAGH